MTTKKEMPPSEIKPSINPSKLFGFVYAKELFKRTWKH